MAEAQQVVSGHEIGGSSTGKSAQIRDLEVRAIWDGLPEHPVNVRIQCTIKPESGLRIPILECDGERMAVISVATIKIVDPGHVDREATALRHYSDEFSGETLTVSNADLFLKDPFMHTTATEQKSHLFPRSGDLFDDPLWAKDLSGFVQQTSAIATGAFGNQFSETKDNDSVHLVPCDLLVGDKRSTSTDTVEIHLLSTPPSRFGNEGPGPLDIPGQGNCKGAGDQALEASDALGNESPRKLRVKKRAERSKRQAQKEKTPWQPPSKAGLSPKSKESTVLQPSTFSSSIYHKSTPKCKPNKLAVARGTTLRNSISKSTEPLRQSSGNCLGTGTPGTSSRLKQAPSALARLRANTPQKIEENAAIRAKPFLSEPRAMKPVFGQSMQSLDNDEPGQECVKIFEDMQDEDNEISSPLSLISSRSTLGFPSQPHGQAYSQQSSPTTCERTREASKTRVPHSSGQFPEIDSCPIWMIEDGKLVICFPKDVTSTLLGIDVEAEVRLVSVDGYDWQSFGLEVCSHLDLDNVIGLFSFVIEQELGQSEIPDAQFRTESLFDSHVAAAKHITGMFIAAEPLQLALRSKKPEITIPFYTMKVGLRGTAIWSEEKGFQIKYRASLAIEYPDYDFFAGQITLLLNIKNWSLCTGTYYVGKGETSVVLRDDHPHLDRRLSELTEASLAIVRDAADIESSLELVFTVSYGRISPIAVALPHIHPADGKVVTESVLISDPSPGLFVEHWACSSFSTWKTTEHVKDDIRFYSFDRNPIPFAFPEGLKDDIIVKLVRQGPVHFKALEEPNDPVANVTSENVILNFKLNVTQMLGGLLECRMILDVQVTKGSQLLTIDHHDWNPKLSLVDGQLATEDVAEWRETVDGNSTLFKTERVVTGQTIRVEFQWDEWEVQDEFKEDDCESFVVYDLPRVVSKTVLGGSLQCNVNGCTVTLDDGFGEMVYRGIDGPGDRVRLPTLRDGYKMELAFQRDRQGVPPRLEHNPPTQPTPRRVFFAGGFPWPSRQVRFADELSESSSDSVDEISATIVQDSDAASTYSSEFDESPLPQLTGSTKSELSKGSSGAFNEITATIIEGSNPESIPSSEFDENPLLAWTGSAKSERAIPASTIPLRKTRSIVGRTKYVWYCLLGFILLFRKLLDLDADAARSALDCVQRITTNIEQLALSIVPIPMDDAMLRTQVPQQSTADNEDATTSVQGWVLSATADGDVVAQAPGAGSRGDAEIVHYKSFEVIDVDNEKNGVHSVGRTGNGRSVRDWIDYSLGWKGERHE